MKYLLKIRKELENFSLETAEALYEEIDFDLTNDYKMEICSPEWFAYEKLLKKLWNESVPWSKLSSE